MKPAESFNIYGLKCTAYKNEKNKSVTVKLNQDGFTYEFKQGDIWIDTKNLFATAKAHPNDVFKYHIGVTVATNKLLKKINKNIINTINDLNKQIQPFTEFVDNHTIKTLEITK